jgi:hypothetical protein
VRACVYTDTRARTHTHTHTNTPFLHIKKNKNTTHTHNCQTNEKPFPESGSPAAPEAAPVVAVVEAGPAAEPAAESAPVEAAAEPSKKKKKKFTKGYQMVTKSPATPARGGAVKRAQGVMKAAAQLPKAVAVKNGYTVYQSELCVRVDVRVCIYSCLYTPYVSCVCVDVIS